MFTNVRDQLRATLDEITEAGLHKPERGSTTGIAWSVALTCGE